jgi:hypothetical protein
VQLSSPRAFEDLSTFVLSDHALELQQQLIFRRSRMRRLDEYHRHVMAGQLLNEQNHRPYTTEETIRKSDSFEISTR